MCIFAFTTFKNVICPTTPFDPLDPVIVNLSPNSPSRPPSPLSLPLMVNLNLDIIASAVLILPHSSSLISFRIPFSTSKAVEDSTVTLMPVLFCPPPPLPLTPPPFPSPTLPLSPSQVVDDNIVNQVVASRMLQRYGVDCTAVPGGREALQATREAEAEGRPFDAIFMDVQMPVMDGWVAAWLGGCQEGMRSAQSSCLASHGVNLGCIAIGLRVCKT